VIVNVRGSRACPSTKVTLTRHPRA
jgi:hypothetical protein